MNQMGQVRVSMAVLIQLFVVLTGLNEHNTGGSPCPKMVSGRSMAPDPPSCVLMHMTTPSLMATVLCAQFET